MKKIKPPTLSDRLQHALEITGMKKADLARAIDVQPQTIQHLCNGNVKSSRFTFELATVLGLNTTWLATGEGTPFLSDDPKNSFFDEYKV
ncbi:MAG: helix-turn-helix transcriptional regulator, partial [Gammaproteobacteria bacterium]|nr:helix-turn-helix transcriptional regulator [Gammaproteobacteria bacterium]